MNDTLGRPETKTSTGPAKRRNWTRSLCAAVAVLALGACANVPGSTANKQGPSSPPVQAVKADSVKVAILLPLSGQQAGIGRALLNAAELALFDVADQRMDLLPRDTGGTPAGAAQAAQKALADGATMILGPLFAQEVAAVRPIATAAGVEMVAFTTDRRLAAPGVNISGFVPADQVNRVVAFTRASGVTNFAAFVPRTPYGDTVLAALQESTRRLSAQLVTVERYDPAMNDLSLPAKGLAGFAPAPQAVLLADDDAGRAQQAAAALAAAGMTQPTVRLLGTGVWDVPGLGREPALVGARFAAPDPKARADFEARYKALYGGANPRIATLAYDAAALAASLIKRDPGSPRPLTRAALTADKGFAGVDGLFRLRNDGSVERGLAVLEVTADGTRIADPAPVEFQFLGQ